MGPQNRQATWTKFGHFVEGKHPSVPIPFSMDLALISSFTVGDSTVRKSPLHV